MKRPRRLSLNKLNDTADLREPSDGPRVRPVPGSLEREREKGGEVVCTDLWLKEKKNVCYINKPVNPSSNQS